MEKAKKMIVCATCAGEFDASLVRCPYCGTAYALAEEEEYMEQLDDIRKDLGSVDADGTKSLQSGSGRMICEKCKHEIGPEELKCRHCGADNPFALQHQQNMKQFDKEYGITKKKVLDSAHKTGGLAKRAAILIVLIIGCIITSAISSENYSKVYHGTVDDPDIRRDGERNAAKYVVEAEEYLKNRDYMGYIDFLRSHDLKNFMPDEFEHLRKVSYVAENYYECIRGMEEIILRSDDPDYFDGLDTDISNFCRYNQIFYEGMENRDSSEAYHECVEDMKAEMDAAIKTYFGMDDEKLEAFISASEVQKAVMLEEVLRHE